MTQNAQLETLVGRKQELRQLRAAIQERESRLVWGPADAGKTSLITRAITDLTETERHNCIYWTGTASGRELISHFVRGLYLAGDPFVRMKVRSEGAAEDTLKRWLARQSVLRLRGILFTALTQGKYRLFLDHFPPPTHNMARLMKEIMYRCKTPIYLAARGCSQAEIGYAWSLYWTHELRVHLGPLTARAARELLETCIRRFGLAALELEGFREAVLRLSGHLPGSIVNMCELAAQPRYHYGDQIKIKLVRVDYLMRSNSSGAQLPQDSFQ